MKAFLASVAVAILVIIAGTIVMKGDYMASKEVYQSPHGSVNL